MKKKIFVFFCLLMCFHSYGQVSSRVDSLNNNVLKIQRSFTLNNKPILKFQSLYNVVSVLDSLKVRSPLLNYNTRLEDDFFKRKFVKDYYIHSLNPNSRFVTRKNQFNPHGATNVQGAIFLGLANGLLNIFN